MNLAFLATALTLLIAACATVVGPDNVAFPTGYGNQLRYATVDPARMYGFRDIGSLEPGKLADLVILDADPTQDIRNTERISKLMLIGRLYDSATLNEEVTGTRRRQPYFWEQVGASGAQP